jgi:lysine decarboxylase
MVQTSSPGFPILKSLDDARAWMEDNGRQRLSSLQQLLHEVRSKMQSRGYRDAHEIWRDLPLSFDPTRLVIDAPQGGYALAQSLREQGIDVEMADERRVVCIFTVMDGRETADRLLSALFRSAGQSKFRPDSKPASFPMPRRLMNLRQAALSHLQTVPFWEAIGRIAGASAGLYPPGIPLVTPGEEITAQVVSLIASAPAEYRFGLSAGQFLCVKQ